MYFTSDNLDSPGIAHGFFGRKGGVSEGIYNSLNCGPGSKDAQANIIENRRRAAEAMQAEPERFCTLYQIHSNIAFTVDTPWKFGESPQGDALVTAQPGLMIGILTADCGPILFADAKNKVVGAAHAGWKGAMTGVLEAALDAMERLGAKREDISAALGPCIAQASYEVGEDYRDRFLEDRSDNSVFFAPSAAKPGKWHFDLPGYILHRLKNAGLSSIKSLAKDTCLEENDFFSFRRSTLRSEPDYGRQLSAIMIKK